MTNCEYCNKPLKKIGTQRSNGKIFEGNHGKDWKERKYHKKCWKEIQEEKKFQLMLDSLKQERHLN